MSFLTGYAKKGWELTTKNKGITVIVTLFIVFPLLDGVIKLGRWMLS